MTLKTLYNPTLENTGTSGEGGHVDPWDLKSQMLAAIANKGGFVNCHGHFDKSYYITKEGLNQSMVPMEQKWRMSDDIKMNDTQEQVEGRISRVLDLLIAQGSNLSMSFIDAYAAVGHKPIDAANAVKEKYKDAISFLTATQPLGGLVEPKEREIYEAITAKADIVGGLPSFDRPNDDKHYDALFSIAKNLDKPIHCHIDQENNPNERDTEKLIEYTKKHGYEGRVVAIHAISVSAQPKEYRSRIYKEMADLGISVVVSPAAALSMIQLDQFTAPVHNSIANVPEMIEAGITVGIGFDDVSDFYQPFIDGDLWIELRMLAQTCRFYDFDTLVDIASVNGKKILSIT